MSLSINTLDRTRVVDQKQDVPHDGTMCELMWSNLEEIGAWGGWGCCGNVAAILELDENLDWSFKIFDAAPQESRGVPIKNPPPDYFL